MASSGPTQQSVHAQGAQSRLLIRSNSRLSTCWSTSAAAAVTASTGCPSVSTMRAAGGRPALASMSGANNAAWGSRSLAASA